MACSYLKNKSYLKIKNFYSQFYKKISINIIDLLKEFFIINYYNNFMIYYYKLINRL